MQLTAWIERHGLAIFHYFQLCAHMFFTSLVVATASIFVHDPFVRACLSVGLLGASAVVRWLVLSTRMCSPVDPFLGEGDHHVDRTSSHNSTGPLSRRLVWVLFLVLLLVYLVVQYLISSTSRTSRSSIWLAVVYSIFRSIWRLLCWQTALLENHETYSRYRHWYLSKLLLFDFMGNQLFFITLGQSGASAHDVFQQQLLSAFADVCLGNAGELVYVWILRSRNPHLLVFDLSADYAELINKIPVVAMAGFVWPWMWWCSAGIVLVETLIDVWKLSVTLQNRPIRQDFRHLILGTQLIQLLFLLVGWPYGILFLDSSQF